MWSYRLCAPRQFERVEKQAPVAASLLDGEVLLRTVVGGLCGSDLPAYRGSQSALPQDVGVRAAALDGYPMHEIVGEVVASREDSIQTGDLVVGWASRFDGLAEYVVSDGAGLIAYPQMRPERAVGIQPLACVLFAMNEIGDVAGRTVAVIGQGPIGVLFSHAAKARGARHVVAVDPVDRSDTAKQFGVDESICSTSDRWVTHLSDAERADVVVEAVGHQVRTLTDAVVAAAPEGKIFYFGVVDDEVYPLNMRLLLRKNLTLMSGVTLRRKSALLEATRYVDAYPDLLTDYITTFIPVSEVGRAFEEASRPQPSRLKVCLDMTA